MTKRKERLFRDFDLYAAMYDVRNPRNWQIFRIKSLTTLADALQEAEEEGFGLAFTLGETQRDATERILAGKLIEEEEAVQFANIKYGPEEESRFNPSWIRTKRDEVKWERAKKQALKEYGKPIKWAVVTTIYKKMGGKI